MIVEGLALPRYDAEPLVGDMPPFGHQVISRETIAAQDEFYLALTAPTGSGKTNAWAVPALTGDRLGVVFALYPTNALARDQYRSLCRLRDHLNPSKPVEYLDAECLGLKRDDYDYHMTKGDVLERIVRTMKRSGGIIITNPDIFIYGLKGYFSNHYLASVLKNMVSTVVFDEFHLFDLKQTDMIFFLLDEISSYDSTQMKRFIFLSATPNERALAKIRDVMHGNLVIAGPRCDRPVVDEVPVMPEVDLRFIRGRRFDVGEAVLADIDRLMEFCTGCRTAVILDSPAEVWMVADFLQEHTNLRICEMSGYHRGSMDEPFDVLVGNKAVEVGIDFKGETAIQRLIFSAHSLSEFLQRFGRLRNPEPGVAYQAICYAPRETVDHFSSVERVSRSDLEAELRMTMRDPRVAQSFSWRYGYLEAWEHICKHATGIGTREARAKISSKGHQALTGGVPSDRRDKVMAEGCGRLYHHYFEGTGITPEEMFLRPGLVPLENYTQGDVPFLDLIDELVSFRGKGMDLAYLDTTDGRSGTYDLFFLLRWTDLEVVTREEFMRALPEERRSWGREVAERVVGYVFVRGRVKSPRMVKMEGIKFQEMERLDQDRLPQVIFNIGPYVRSRDPAVPVLDINAINKVIKKKGVFCRYFAHNGYVAQELFDLDDYLKLVPFKDGSLALNLDALYADCAAFEHQIR
ncbi:MULTISPECIES: type I-D CRISPR-associated helicase Cas3' [unclassified Methanoculleus]|jgi:CRISPR-associated endonuclease/helicase Cas3|uniref:type I-D CRISPR-associated helicase Cas3' n=1 Tax=unclassified Methanoculleus TaxID=2619537 RepID=UPI0025F101AF|nr:type I-D CRISPR-associated helicase Cas3' [Methanoculleus sp. UBA377]